MSLDDLLTRQCGVATRAQLLDHLAPSTLTRGLAAGRWLGVLPRVYRRAQQPLSAAALLHAAVLWAGRDAVVSGASAAWWLGVLAAPAPGPVQVTVPRARRGVEGVRVRRRDLSDLDTGVVRGLPVTRLPLTLLEVAVTRPDGPALLDRALQRSVDLRMLVEAYHRNLGRHGSEAAGDLLTAAADGAASGAERILVGLLREHGVEGWELGFAVGGYLLDLAFVGAKVAVEVDGWAYHSDVTAFRGDRRRQNVLVLAGWTVLRFTWHDLTTRPAAVVAEILTAVRRADRRSWTGTAR